jgi:uncharacterized integral membrane protein
LTRPRRKNLDAAARRADNAGMFKAYLYITVSLVLLVATAVFLVLQWDVKTLTCRFTFYGSPREAPAVVVMLVSAVAGFVLYFVLRLMGRGIVLLRRQKRQLVERARLVSEVRAAQDKSDAETGKP